MKTKGEVQIHSHTMTRNRFTKMKQREINIFFLHNLNRTGSEKTGKNDANTMN